MKETRSADAKQSFLAMCRFLEMYWERGRSEEIAALLSSLALRDDGECADPALWEDWNSIFQKIITSPEANMTAKSKDRKPLELSSTKAD